jgi:hypothetical protein
MIAGRHAGRVALLVIELVWANRRSELTTMSVIGIPTRALQALAYSRAGNSCVFTARAYALSTCNWSLLAGEYNEY